MVELGCHKEEKYIYITYMKILLHAYINSAPTCEAALLKMTTAPRVSQYKIAADWV